MRILVTKTLGLTLTLIVTLSNVAVISGCSRKAKFEAAENQKSLPNLDSSDVSNSLTAEDVTDSSATLKWNPSNGVTDNSKYFISAKSILDSSSENDSSSTENSVFNSKYQNYPGSVELTFTNDKMQAKISNLAAATDYSLIVILKKTSRKYRVEYSVKFTTAKKTKSTNGTDSSTESSSSSSSFSSSSLEQVAAPIISLTAGTYTSTQSVTLSSTTSGASIYYTTDGSTPSSSSTLYSGAISVAASTTLKVIAVKSGMTDSTISSALYTITGTVAAPNFSVGTGTYSSTQTVSLSTTTSGATIYYTIDGSTPTTSSSVYSSALSVASTTTVKAYAVKAAHSDSSVSTATYNISGAQAATWAQEAYIKASNNGTISFLNFGASLALDGDTLVVGTKAESSNQTTITNGTTSSSDTSSASSGAAFVYKRTGLTWAQEAYIKASNANAGDFFGASIALHNDTLVVGAPYEDSNETTITNGISSSSNNSASSAGAAFVYKRTGSIWAQEAYIKASNAEASDQFGYSVSIYSDTVVVSTINEGSNQTTITNGTTSSSDNTAGSSGAIYVYKRTGTNWAQEAYIKASNSQLGDGFGQVVSIFGDTIVVTASYEDSNQTTITNGTTSSSDNSFSNSGAAYVFIRTGSTWAQQAYLKASNAIQGVFFGNSASVNRDTIIIGDSTECSNQTTVTNGTTSSSDTSACYSGAAYVYKRYGRSGRGSGQRELGRTIKEIK